MELYSTQLSNPLTTLTLMRFSGATRVWMLAQMAFARRPLRLVRGLRFWKLLGTGVGFSLQPDFDCYGMLAVWESAEDADVFFAASPLMAKFRERAAEIWTVRMTTVQAHGSWSGTNPFLPAASALSHGPLIVLTRATIRWSRLRAFWSSAPAANHSLAGVPGLLLTVGVGEAPVVRQATFSVWRSEADMRAFAYRTPVHAEVIRRTREECWYAEDLFARFAPIASVGTWGGCDPFSETGEHGR